MISQHHGIHICSSFLSIILNNFQAEIPFFDRQVGGHSSTDMVKINNIQGQEAIIVGFTEPKGSRQYFGRLLLAVKKNGKLVSIGNVGTGFTDNILKELHGKLKPLICKTSPLDIPIKETPDITWVDAELVCNINFTEINEEGSARHMVYQGLRVDKPLKEVVLETPVSKVKRLLYN